MLPPHAEQLLAVVAAGAALAAVGLLNLLALATHPIWRVAGSALACGAGFVTVYFTAPGAFATAGVVLACGLGPVLLFSVPRVVSVVRSSSARWGITAVFGVLAVGAGIVRFEYAEERYSEAELLALEQVALLPPQEIAIFAPVDTDRGTRIAAGLPARTRERDVTGVVELDYLRRTQFDEHVIRRGPARGDANCHGWVFTAGRYIVLSRAVPDILADNGYVHVSDPRPGDLVVYREQDRVLHTAIVRYVSDGMPVLVEGKWGALGVYLHPVNKSPYGPDFGFYRSTRPGHLLTGVGPAKAADGM